MQSLTVSELIYMFNCKIQDIKTTCNIVYVSYFSCDCFINKRRGGFNRDNNLLLSVKKEQKITVNHPNRGEIKVIDDQTAVSTW